MSARWPARASPRFRICMLATFPTALAILPALQMPYHAKAAAPASCTHCGSFGAPCARVVCEHAQGEMGAVVDLRAVHEPLLFAHGFFFAGAEDMGNERRSFELAKLPTFRQTSTGSIGRPFVAASHCSGQSFCSNSNAALGSSFPRIRQRGLTTALQNHLPRLR